MSKLDKPETEGSEAFKLIGKPLARLDGLEKVTGKALFVADLEIPDVWLAGVLRSPVAAGRLKGIAKDPHFDWSKVTVVTAEDLPGPNAVSMVRDDYEVFAKDRISFATQALAAVAAPDRETLDKALASLKADVLPEAPILTLEDSIKAETVIWGTKNVIDEFRVQRGDMEKGFAEADVIVEGTYRTPYQEHVYLETQGMVAWPKADGAIVEGSMQCPYYVHGALAKALAIDTKNVTVRQSVTGGGFGGKEDYPSVMAIWVALLANTCGHPVKLVYDRSEDLLVSTKRHPSKVYHKTGVKRDGTITAMEVDILLDGGAATTMSKVVLSRSILHCTCGYKVLNANLHARAMATNSPPNGAFRGFGAPQSIFAMERQMDKIAFTLGMDPLSVRLKNVLRRGDSFPYGQVMDEGVFAAEVLEDVAERLGYREKRKRYAEQTGHVRRGIGLSLCLHGGGFTGSGEDNMGTKVEVEVVPGGVVEVLGSSTDMGQGASTVLPMIAAEALSLPLSKVRYPRPDTSRSPNSGPTVASRTTMYVGMVVRDASLNLLAKLKAYVEETHGGPVSYKEGIFYDYDGEVKIMDFDEAASRWFKGKDEKGEKGKKDRLLGVASYKPDASAAWDDEKYQGHAYKGYAWMAQAVEVEVNCDTYEVTPIDSAVAVELGRAINPAQIVGQIEGGVLQSYGWSTIEDLTLTPEGKYSTGHLNAYLVPTTLDTPHFEVRIFEDPCAVGPYGAKGIGELPMDGGAPAVAAAVENALGVEAIVDKVPLTGEELHRLMSIQMSIQLMSIQPKGASL
ncbi:MAG: xanthine dehydrogenase family protein molybdopterin-binding subunit [Synergistaceae bacterium]|nr:xanthine dehydrogenase family protein molybdopterin-binding subunit [Synergistaceae bacterium]